MKRSLALALPVLLAAATAHGGSSEAPMARFEVDSWFRANGEPAVVQPLDDWVRNAPIAAPG